MSAPDLVPIAAALARHYDLPDAALTPVRGGQNTINLRGTTSGGRRVFVKTYPKGTDLDAEHGALALSERAGAHGVPVAPLIRDLDGHLLHTQSPVAFSVWGWVDGHVVTHPQAHHCVQAGRALGRIHAAFADLPVADADRDVALSGWCTTDTVGLAATIETILAAIDTRTRADAFDAVAAATLAERRTMLTHLPALAARVDDALTVQVLHGDYSPVNLLFTPHGEELAAVLDFGPPRPDLVAYDLGRMAFYPHTVTGSRDWMGLAEAFITAYLDAHPGTRRTDVRTCGTIALLQLVRSLYGVKQHYLKPGLDQDALDDFWVLRHRAARTLLDHLPHIDRMLDRLAHDHLPQESP
ncbi:phosphotransferase enzyme family protein [Nocardiopsis synnemataformans]|uniref:phosphotransferase enzyme family protein n=1 Tax=Nocardiopsis synnemataformans TaxID=61305 RepID=UPI003EBC075C